MELRGLQVRLKRIVESDEFHREMWRYIKEELQGVIIYMQKDQLFEKSIGADGNPLGFYSNKKFKDYGEPFSMVYTGDFRDKLVINVNRKSRVITITSTTSHLDEMLSNEVFLTHNFFGLTIENTTRLINGYILSHMKVWTEHFLTEKI